MSDTPEKQPSDEVDINQIQQSRTEGQAYLTSATYMTETVAHDGGTTTAGDYLVGYAQEEAEPLYRLAGEGEFELVEPDDENCHLEVIVADRADHRFVPYCDVSITLDRDGESYGPFDLSFLWHPGVYHYGANLEVPESGTYDLHVTIEPPEFHRHDETNGDRYGETVEVTFEEIAVETGQD
ncbi:iron transporter [Haloarcula onubensis]|uniref:Iron transporter n=1 Tax=Haloarcula onubensis TaxID=2950539 RepID=A0ABU2FRF0_9EURY|nr:iron transporter [Halomicroarcula sp. S3CR25-11]MDS0283350.1 iron transporter [Halomicroarcula sp. S3CR25-11]